MNSQSSIVSTTAGDYISYTYPYPTPTYTPQQIVVYPQPYFVQQIDYGTQTRLDDIEARLSDVSATLKRLMDLLGNDQDEEVCGYSNGECNSADSEGGPGKVLALRAPEPRGSTTWPPRS